MASPPIFYVPARFRISRTGSYLFETIDLLKSYQHHVHNFILYRTDQPTLVVHFKLFQ